MSKTSISWTDATWNPISGCDRVSPGCANCYALTLAARLKAMGQPRYQRDGDPRTSGPGFGLTLHEDRISEPLKWREPRMVFVNSMSDLFHEDIPLGFTARVFATMEAATHHVFQILTKRPEQALRFMGHYVRARELAGLAGPLDNVWLGVSIESARYTWRADVLREIPAAVRFISAEPLLGSLYDAGPRGRPNGELVTPGGGDGDNRLPGEADDASDQPRGRAPLDLTGIDWLIVGGESGGRDVRPMHPAWARELRDACLAEDYVGPGDVGRVGPAFYFKQWGSYAPYRGGDTFVALDGRHGPATGESGPGAWLMRYCGVGPESGGRLLDGREHLEWPDVKVPEVTLF